VRHELATGGRMCGLESFSWRRRQVATSLPAGSKLQSKSWPLSRLGLSSEVTATPLLGNKKLIDRSAPPQDVVVALGD
jgi:hypothetical protein